VFCDRAVFGEDLRLRSPVSVLDEVEELVGKYGAREIRFLTIPLRLTRAM